MVEPTEPIDILARINQLRCMYWTSGAFIWLFPASKMLEIAERDGATAPMDAFGIVTNGNELVLNADQKFAARPNSPPFIYTPELTILHGPTFVHALEWGFYRLVCNFAGRIDDLTEDDVLQHARDLKRWFNNPLRPQPSGEPKYCQDINQTLEYMREFGRGTPMVALVDSIRKKKKGFLARLFGT